MTTRTTHQELRDLAAMASRATGEEYTVEWAYGRPRLYRAGGSIEVSPRLSTGDMAEWLYAFLAGIDAGKKAPR